MQNDPKKNQGPPQMSPYIFTILLLGFGLWCFWDGWITKDPEMLRHANFNRVLSVILLSWGIYDLFKLLIKKKNKKEADKING